MPPRPNNLGLRSVDLELSNWDAHENVRSYLEDDALPTRYRGRLSMPHGFAVFVCRLSLEQLKEREIRKMVVGIRRGAAVKIGTTAISSLGAYLGPRSGKILPAIAAKLGSAPLMGAICAAGEDERVTTYGLERKGSAFVPAQGQDLVGLSRDEVAELGIPAVGNM